MNYKQLKLLIPVLFLSFIPIYSMQLRNKGLGYVFSLASIGFVAQQYKEKYTSYNEFLNTKKAKESDNEVFYSQSLPENLIIETKVRRDFHKYKGFKPLKKYRGIKTLKLREERDGVSSVRFTVKKEKPSEHYECYINCLETNEKYQKKGYATLLLQDLEDEMQKSNCRIMALSSLNHKIAFYEKRGFRINKSREPECIGFDCTVMEKELPEIK